jgi:hypothetical protein
MSCIDWQMVEAIATCVAAIATLGAVFGLWLVKRQVSEQVRATGLTALMHIQTILQAGKMREKRKKIFDLLLEKDSNSEPTKRYLNPDKLTTEEIKDLEYVSQAWDRVGQLVSLGLLSAEWFMRSWNDSVRRSWAVAHKLVRQYQRERHRAFWAYFEELAWRSYFTTDPGHSTYEDNDVIQDFKQNVFPEYLRETLPRHILYIMKKFFCSSRTLCP